MNQKSFRTAAVFALAWALAGCSSDSKPTSKPSSGSSNTSPPAIDLGAETPPPGATGSSAPAESSATSSAPPDAGGWGNLEGRFVYDGAAPARKPVEVTKDIEFCSKDKPMFEDLVVNAENGGIANVVIMLYPKRGEKAPVAHPSYDSLLSEPKRLDNHGCRFEPHIQTVRVGQQLIVGNKDEVGHNTNAALANQPFNELIGVGADVKKSIAAAERTPSVVTCNIHPWMKAYLIVTEHPYVAVTDANGNFKIENLPTGEWTFQIWQEKSGFVEEVERGGKTEKWAKGRPVFAVKEGDNALGDIKVKPAVFEE